MGRAHTRTHTRDTSHTHEPMRSTQARSAHFGEAAACAASGTAPQGPTWRDALAPLRCWPAYRTTLAGAATALIAL